MDKEQQILTAARNCFLHFGFKATTVELIAKNAKIGKGTVYNFFSTKEDILEKVIDLEIQGLIQIADKLMLESTIEISTFQKYLFISLEYVNEGDLFHQLFIEVESASTPEVIRCLEKVEKIAFMKLKEMIELYIQQKQLLGYNPELSTFLMLELYDRLVYKWPKNHSPLTKDQINEIFLKLYPLV
jgi:AcrR family transcriptional regulator